MSKNPFYRTHDSDLSDDELLLLDVLFNCNAQLKCLRREGFVELWNSPSHNLHDAQLQRTIGEFCDRRILESHCYDDVEIFEMTELGGALWESERCPVWERYATERYDETISEKSVVTILATSANTRDDFLRLGGPCGTWQLTNARIRKFKITRHVLISWRRLPCLYVGIGVNITDNGFRDLVRPEGVSPLDWSKTVETVSKRRRIAIADLELHRTWWRNVRELQKFVAASD